MWADIGGTGRLKRIGPLVVSGGAVTLPNNQVASTIVAALGYVAVFESAKLAYGAQLGTAISQKKKIDHVGMPMYDTYYQGVQQGQSMDLLDPLPALTADQATAAGTVWNEFDEPMIPLPGTWDTDARLFLVAQAPNPAMIGGLVIGMDTSEKG